MILFEQLRYFLNIDIFLRVELKHFCQLVFTHPFHCILEQSHVGLGLFSDDCPQKSRINWPLK